jgi:cystathionine gamma-synthase
MSTHGFFTRAAHAGEDADRTMTTRPKTMPLYETSVFVYDSLGQTDEFLGGNPDSYMYTRLGNPNQRALEEWGMALEEGEAAHVTSSGMSALMATLLSECSSGDHIVAARDIYGGSQSLLQLEVARFGITVDLVDIQDIDVARSAFRPNTRILLVEIASNPLVRVADIPALSVLARQHQAKLVVDNTFLSPVLFQPLKHGADASVHSTTKYISGHSDAMGGLIVASRDWISRCRRVTHNMGGMMTPFAAWLTLRGAKTLPLRMQRHTENAEAFSLWLERHPSVSSVSYPGLPSHPQYELARRLFPAGCGGILSFDVRGGVDAADRLVRNLKIVKFAPSLAGVTTTISHPGKTSHRGLSPTALTELGISPATIRVSVGIEDLADIQADFDRALTR